MWFTRISIANPVLATMMMAAFVVLGLFSYQRLPVDQFPDVAFPVVVVQTEYPGASPQIIESDVTRKIEEQVNTVSGVNKLSSRSYEGLSVVIVEFDLLTDPARAAQDVREKVALVKSAFKREVKEPTISRFNPDDQPVVSLALRSAQRDPRELTTLADQVVKRRIENARGVGRVSLVGGVKRQVQIARGLARRVDLKSGGYLIIDQTEALTTIDVNTGGYIGGRSFDDTIFKTNLEAAQAIARQLRLRNLGGIIIVDFIDMASTDHRDSVLAELRRALARDRTKTSVNGFTALGLVEMTRKRTRESLAHVMCEPCPTCGGRGELKTARTVCYEILREIQREATQFKPKEFRIVASQDVIDLFLEEEAQPLATLGDAIGKRIALQVESLYTQEQYDIILM